MKIMIPIISFSKSGGMKVISNLANYWVSQGHEVTIACVLHGKPYYETSANIVFIDKSKKNKLSFIKCMYLLFIFIKKFEKEFDVVMANYNTTAYPVFFAAKNKGVYYIQAYEPEFFDGIKGNYLKRKVLKLIAWVSYFLPLMKVVNSNMYMKYKNIRASSVVYPGIDLKVYWPKKRVYKNPSDIFKVGCIGRVEKWKGSEDVAEAVRILHTKGYKNIELVVAFNALTYKNHQLVFPDSDHKLAEYYQSLDVLITPGHIQLDAIHYPVIEAMATKTPLITTGYFPSSTVNSFIVSVQSPYDIAEKIIYIMSNYEEAVSKAELAYNNIYDFSWDATSKKFIKIIEDRKC